MVFFVRLSLRTVANRMRKRQFRQLFWCFFLGLCLTGCAHWPESVCRQCSEAERVEPKSAVQPLQAARWEDLPGWAEDVLVVGTAFEQDPELIFAMSEAVHG